MFRYLFIIAFLCAFQSLIIGQESFSFSSDGRYYAEIKPVADSVFDETKFLNIFSGDQQLKATQYAVLLYDLKTKGSFEKILVTLSEPGSVKKIQMSPDGKGLLTSIGNYTFVYNLRNGKLTGEFYTPSEEPKEITNREPYGIHPDGYQHFCFPNFDFVYLIKSERTIDAYDIFSGQFLYSYTGFSRSALFDTLYFTKDDKYLIARDQTNKYYIWEAENQSILKRLSGESLLYSASDSLFYLVKKFSSSQNLYVYDAKDFSQADRISSNAITRDFLRYNKSPSSPLYKETFSEGGYPSKLNVLNFIPDPSLKYGLITTEKDKISNLNLIFNLQTGNILYSFESKAVMEPELFPFWTDHKKLVLPEGDNKYQLYEYKTDTRLFFVLEEPYEYMDVPKKDALKEGRSFKADGLKFSAFGITNNNFSRFVLAQNYPLKKLQTLQNHTFKAFVSEDKFLIQDMNDIPYLIDAELLFAENGILENAYVQFFDQAVANESAVSDAKAPSGYKYYRINEIRDFNPEDQSVYYELLDRSIEVNDTLVDMNFHIVDEFGRYYSGAATDSAGFIWCGVYITSEDGKIVENPEHKITEHLYSSEIKNAISLVMDHSGSMGEERVLNLQQGALRFIKQKRPQDGVALVKYDHVIGIESQLSTNQKSLVSSLQMDGTGDYGGGTALLDALNGGISLIKNKRGYDKKIVVLFTDGIENSSLISKENILLRAVDNNIKVFTIGFGDYVDNEYLKFISSYTGGNYYRLYDTKDLTWIFEDIYNKVNNYYTLSVKTPFRGKQKIILKLCLPDGTDETLITEFDNTPFEFNDDFLLDEIVANIGINKSVELSWGSPEFNLLNEQIFIKPEDFNSDPIVINPTRRVVLLSEFQEIGFPDIKFRFDKTDIIEGTEKGLDELIEFMKKYPESIIAITGHTDSIGSESYNDQLSVNRAKKVRQLMVDQGISISRIKIAGEGERKPIAQNTDFKTRLQNRRVEFRLVYP